MKSYHDESLVGCKFIEGISVNEAIQILRCVQIEIRKHSRIDGSKEKEEFK